MKVKYSILHYWKSIIIIICILYLSFISPATFKGIPKFENEDKLVHLIMFAGLTGSLILDFRQFARNNQTTLKVFILLCLIFPVVLGGAIEILQPMYFAPRSADWLDWFSDITGVLVGWTGAEFIKRKFSK